MRKWGEPAQKGKEAALLCLWPVCATILKNNPNGALWTDGGRRTTDTRTPRGSIERAVCSETRGVGESAGCTVSSVVSRPGAGMPVPEVAIKGPIRAAKGGAGRFDGAPIDLATFLELGEVVNERRVDYRLRRRI